MNNRLQQFLSAENLSQAQLAEIIGVARASVSHIIAGRNKPGFDFIEGMISHFPNLNIEWLISGKGKMYRNAPGLFAQEEAKDDIRPEKPADTTEVEPVEMPETVNAAAFTTQPGEVSSKRRISKIIVFFDDNTFQELA